MVSPRLGRFTLAAFVTATLTPIHSASVSEIALLGDISSNSGQPSANGNQVRVNADQAFIQLFVATVQKDGKDPAVKLARDRGPEVADNLLPLLLHTDSQVQYAAAEAIRGFGPNIVLKFVFAGMAEGTDTRDYARLAALRIISYGDAPRPPYRNIILEFIRESTSNPRVEIRLAAFHALASSVIRGYNMGKRGELPVPQNDIDLAVNGAKDESPEVRRAAYEALRMFGKSNNLPSLYFLAGIHDPDATVRATVVREIANSKSLKTDDFLTALIERLEQDDDAHVRAHAATALGTYKERGGAAVPALIRAIQRKDQYAAPGALRALGAIRQLPDLAVPILQVVVNERDDSLFDEAYAALNAYGVTPESLEATVWAAFREGILRGLEPSQAYEIPLDSEEAYRTILKLLVNPKSTPFLRTERYGDALVRLNHRTPEDAYPVLDAAWKQSSPQVRYQVLRTMDALGREKISALPSFSKDMADAGSTDFDVFLADEKLRALADLFGISEEENFEAANYAARQLILLGPRAMPVAEKVAAKVKATGKHADVLAAMGPEAVPFLIQAIQREKGGTNSDVCHVIASIGSAAKSAEPVLLKAVWSNERGNQAVYRALQAIQTDFMAVLPKMLDDETTQVAACWIIQQVGPPAAPLRDRLLELLKAHKALESPKYLQIAKALAATGDDGLQALIQVFKDDPENTQSFFTSVVLELGPAAAPALPALIEHLGDREVQTEDAIVAIGPAAVSSLIEIANKTDDEPRASRAMYGLMKIRTDAAPAMVAELEKANSYRFAYALGKMGYAAIPALELVLKHPDYRVRRRVALALGHSGDSAYGYTSIEMDKNPDTIPYLLEYLKDSDPGVVALAAQGLRANRAINVAQPLREQLMRHGDDEGLVIVLQDCLFTLDTDPTAPITATVTRTGDSWQFATYTTPSQAKLTDKEISSDRPGFRLVEVSLAIDSDSFFLGPLYEPTGEPPSRITDPPELVPSEGFDRKSVEVDWLVPGKILQVTWSTIVNNRTDTPADSTLLVSIDNEHWREIFKTSVQGRSGYIRENSVNAVHFSRNPNSGTVRFVRSYHLYTDCLQDETGTARRLLWTPTSNKEPIEYRLEYGLSTEYPCQFNDTGLQIGPGVGRINLHEGEFPPEEVVKFLEQEQALDGKPVTVERLMQLNPALRGEGLCTGMMVYSQEVKPYRPESQYNIGF